MIWHLSLALKSWRHPARATSNSGHLGNDQTRAENRISNGQLIFELAEGAVRHLAHAAPDLITAGGTQHLEKDIQTVLVDPAEDELDHALAEGIQGPSNTRTDWPFLPAGPRRWMRATRTRRPTRQIGETPSGTTNRSTRSPVVKALARARSPADGPPGSCSAFRRQDMGVRKPHWTQLGSERIVGEPLVDMRIEPLRVPRTW